MHIFYYKKVVEWNEMVSVVWHGSDVMWYTVLYSLTIFRAVIFVMMMKEWEEKVQKKRWSEDEERGNMG